VRVRAVLPLEALVEGVRFRVELKPGPAEELVPGQDWLASVR
jgi:hypothetical protein